MTTTDFDGMMQAHNQQMAALAEKYIGKKEMQRGLSLPALVFKKHWYVSRIKQLMKNAGRCELRRQRCKHNTPKWAYYDTTATELELLADNLALDLLALKDQS